MNDILIYFAIKYKGDWNQIYHALETKEKVGINDITNIKKITSDKRWHIKTIIDNDYPLQLKQCFKPPFVIWIKGDYQLLTNKIICLSGNQLDDQTIMRINKQLPQYEATYRILLLDFKGVDQYLHKCTKQPIIKILAHGIDYHKQESNMLVISEYPPLTSPHQNYYRHRNRIVAAFANQLVLFSSQNHGKILNLVSNFLNLGKEIYCYPGNGDEEDGNSVLIKQGASLITSPDDL